MKNLNVVEADSKLPTLDRDRLVYYVTAAILTMILAGAIYALWYSGIFEKLYENSTGSIGKQAAMILGGLLSVILAPYIVWKILLTQAKSWIRAETAKLHKKHNTDYIRELIEATKSRHLIFLCWDHTGKKHKKHRITRTVKHYVLRTVEELRADEPLKKIEPPVKLLTGPKIPAPAVDLLTNRELPRTPAVLLGQLSS